MKNVFLFLVMAISPTLAAAAPECRDFRATPIEACADGGLLFIVQGLCERSYQFESHYCAPSSGKPRCIDGRIVDVGGCANDGIRIFYQGRCENSFEFEHTYCSGI